MEERALGKDKEVLQEMKTYKVESGCPICHSDVIGNERYRYFCKKCNMLFSFRHLDKRRHKVETKQAPHIQEKTEPPMIYAEETEPVEEPKFVASVKSDKMHLDTCHFINKIRKDNWIHLDSFEDGIRKGYVPCVCIRRRGI